MPKVKNESAKLRQFVEEFSSNVFKTDGKVLYCIICDQPVPVTKRFQVLQHLNTNKHKIHNNLVEKSKQTFIKNTFENLNKQQLFAFDLCQAMLESDIPLWKLNHPSFKSFLEKYTEKSVPDQSTVRKNYVSTIYENNISRIRLEIGDGPIWVSLDVTTDIDGWFVCNVVIGHLHDEYYSEPWLLMSEELFKCNFQTVGKLFNDAMQLLWPSGVKYDNVLLFVTDAAPYMVKAADSLTVLFPNLIHLTCLAHGIHRVCETIRAECTTVDKMISNVKKIFLKAPSLTLKLREMFPNLPLPPKPVLTRWATWLTAVTYYVNNFNSIKSVISELDDETDSIKKAKELFDNQNLKNDLAYIKSNFCFLSQVIIKLQNKSLTLNGSLQIIISARDRLLECNGRVADKVKNKLSLILQKNKGFKTLQSINKILNGESDEDNFSCNLTPRQISLLKYAPTTSCDVERSFSQYKAILRSNRRAFIFENLEKYVVVACNTRSQCEL